MLSVTNIPALSAEHALQRNQALLGQSTLKLSTGRKINAGKDDPAGLITSENLGAALAALEAETRMLQRADSYATVSDGHLSQVSGMMAELDALVVASANEAGLTDSERQANQMQIDNLVSSIERFAADAGASLDGFSMPDGGNAEVAAMVSSASTGLRSLMSGGANSVTGGDLEAAQAAISQARTDILNARGMIGSYQKNTVAPRIQSATIEFENITSARSRIVDTDYAVETSNLTRATILTEATTKVLGIAQQEGSRILGLLSQ